MHPPRLTIGSLLFIVAAFSIGIAAMKENDLKGIGLSMLMIIGLLAPPSGPVPTRAPADGVALAWSVRNPIDRRSRTDIRHPRRSQVGGEPLGVPEAMELVSGTKRQKGQKARSGQVSP